MPVTEGVEANNSGVFVENRQKIVRSANTSLKTQQRVKIVLFCPIAFSNSDSYRNYIGNAHLCEWWPALNYLLNIHWVSGKNKLLKFLLQLLVFARLRNKTRSS
jgi:hypothetical protein